jgi:hypothetical protein
LTAAALPPLATREEEAVGAADWAPRPREEAEVPPAAALPPEPTTPLDPLAAAEPPPALTVEAD